MDKIAGVVVTYNRRDFLFDCLRSLEEQVQRVNAVFIIDNNSTDNTLEDLIKNGYVYKNDILSPDLDYNIESVLKKGDITYYYYRLKLNTGGAGGFYRGLKYSYAKGYQWFWMMDDDCLPEPSCLYNLLKAASNKNNAYTPFVLDLETKSINGYKRIVKRGERDVHEAPFNGFFIHKQLVEKVGFPIEDFFIYKDDTEYCARIQRGGNKIKLITTAIMYHPGKYSSVFKQFKSMLNKRVLYYTLRNTLWIHRKEKMSFTLGRRLKYVALFFGFIFLFKFSYLQVMRQAIKDAKNDKLGKVDEI